MYEKKKNRNYSSNTYSSNTMYGFLSTNTGLGMANGRIDNF